MLAVYSRFEAGLKSLVCLREFNKSLKSLRYSFFGFMLNEVHLLTFYISLSPSFSLSTPALFTYRDILERYSEATGVLLILTEA